MDVKITKKRFFNLIAYDWIKIVAFSVAVILLWTLLFTTCATRATDGQQFHFAVYGDVYSVGEKDYEMLRDMKDDGDLSYDVLSYSVGSITKAGNYSAQYMLSLRNSTYEADVLLLYAGKTNKVIGEETEDTDAAGTDETTVEEKSSDIASILSGNGTIQTVEDLLDGARNYLMKFGADFDSAEPTVDDDLIEKYFRTTRIKEARNYKKTYKTESVIADGVKNEQARIRKLLDAYLHLSEVINAVKGGENDFLRYYMKPVYERGEVVRKDKKAYGIDLTALNKFVTEDDKANGKQMVSDRWYYVDEDENGKQITSTEGITLCVSDYTSVQRELQYEAVTFLDYIVRNFSNY